MSQKLQILRYFGAHTFLLGGYAINTANSVIPTEGKLNVAVGRGKHQASATLNRPAPGKGDQTLTLGYGLQLPERVAKVALQSEHVFANDSNVPKFRDVFLGFHKTLSTDLSFGSKYGFRQGLLSYHGKYRINSNFAVQGSFETAVAAGRAVYQGYRHYAFNFGLKLHVDL